MKLIQEKTENMTKPIPSEMELVFQILPQGKVLSSIHCTKYQTNKKNQFFINS